MQEPKQFFLDKIDYYRKILDNIQIAINKYKLLNIISNNEYNLCIESIDQVINLINTINVENIVSELEYIQNNISSIIKNYGIMNFDFLISICFDFDFSNKYLSSNIIESKLAIIKKYLHPINYKVINWTSKLNFKNFTNKEVVKNKLLDDKVIVEESNMLECYDLMRITNNFNLRIYGIKVIIHDHSNKKTLSINCIIDNLIVNNNTMHFLVNKKNSLSKYIQEIKLKDNDNFSSVIWDNYLEILSLKDYLIYSNEEIVNKYFHICNNLILYEQKTINNLVQDFITSDLFNQRQIILNLLLNNEKYEMQYIAYLLYDLLTNDNINNSDSCDQKDLYNSLPIRFKKLFKDAMYKTIEYTTTLSNFDNNKIPIEQQICLMKVNKNVKERAMQKLKEIKSKSEDSGSKARQYLDGLLKIPFSIYKEEDILTRKNDIYKIYISLVNEFKKYDLKTINENEIKDFLILLQDFFGKEVSNNFQIINNIKIIENNFNELYIKILNYILLNSTKKTNVLNFIKIVDNVCKENNFNSLKFDKNITSMKNSISAFLEKNINNRQILKQLLLQFDEIKNDNIYNYLLHLEKNIIKISNKNNEIINYVNKLEDILDESIFGHKNAKIQIERILGQWLNGEMTGYCFGFEGPPGVGKTTLAKKGLSKCLIDSDGNSRPFSFIALGGSSNGSTIEGHNYTYVGSTWGKIVDILIEKQCMNPIIFIDELDKVSKTEHGKEIIGILTHLTDTTQNDSFQDKYFSNIDLDLSKALFIFSYNDVEQVDKILLDRIHRIKFENLHLNEKLIICEKFLLPELYKNFGLNNVINFDKDLIIFIIENYTNEPGVRKLKELLFEIISSINLDFIKNSNTYDIPFNITKELIQKILKDKHFIRYVVINTNSQVGLVNGMWANAYGNSGILHIETKFFCTNTCFELKLTGMQGDVMKESMNVSKTLAWNLLKENEKKSCLKKFEESKEQGIHIHVPEGATPKDGPSAGAGITLAIYSLLVNKKIRNNYAITGEICLNGKVTAIGGLDLKILGGIRAGVKSFLYPKENHREFQTCYEKYKEKLAECQFYEVSTIHEVIKYMLI
jgi:hypothetical protein